jgi:hypothetical protein
MGLLKRVEVRGVAPNVLGTIPIFGAIAYAGKGLIGIAHGW